MANKAIIYAHSVVILVYSFVVIHDLLLLEEWKQRETEEWKGKTYEVIA